MRLSWNEIRSRAAAFARSWCGAAYEKGETQSFYNDFFAVFGVQRRTVARYEAHVRKLDNRSGFIDLFWPGVLLVEQKSAGRDLQQAAEQADDYFDALKERERPRYILVCDFRTFVLRDLDERSVVTFGLADLPQQVQCFGFILGVQRRTFRDQDPANIEAAELMGLLHDALHGAGYRGHATWSACWCGWCSASLPTTRASSSRGTCLSTSSRRAPARTAPTWDRGWRSCSRCWTHRKATARQRWTRTWPASLI